MILEQAEKPVIGKRDFRIHAAWSRSGRGSFGGVLWRLGDVRSDGAVLTHAPAHSHGLT